MVLKRRTQGAEGLVLPISFAQHFLESCGIWIDQGRVALYGSELELINKQLAIYKSMYTFMTTDLKWSADIVQQQKTTTREQRPELRYGLKISYEKRFTEQLEPKNAKITLFPIVSGGFDREKAKKNGLYATLMEDFRDSDTGVIDNLDSLIEGAITNYNEATHGNLTAADVHTINVEVTPMKEGIKFSTATLSINYKNK